MPGAIPCLCTRDGTHPCTDEIQHCLLGIYQKPTLIQGAATFRVCSALLPSVIPLAPCKPAFLGGIKPHWANPSAVTMLSLVIPNPTQRPTMTPWPFPTRTGKATPQPNPGQRPIMAPWPLSRRKGKAISAFCCNLNSEALLFYFFLNSYAFQVRFAASNSIGLIRANGFYLT